MKEPGVFKEQADVWEDSSVETKGRVGSVWSDVEVSKGQIMYALVVHHKGPNLISDPLVCSSLP